MDDLTWLETHLRPATLDALWPHLDVAEALRLVRRYGYPKDNALPPPLPERLRDPRFVEDLRQSIEEDEDAALLIAVETLMSTITR